MLVKLYICGFDEDFYPNSSLAPPGHSFQDAWRRSPLGLGFLKSNCETANIKIEVVSNKADLTNCDLIGLSATAIGIPEAIHILQHTSVPVVIGGYSAYWDGLRKYPFKHIVFGDGELAFSSILQGSCREQMVRKDVTDLDNLKFPYRVDCVWQIRSESSRGCCYRCAFCTFPKNAQPRFHSPEWFIDDILQAQKQFPDIHRLDISDDLFVWNQARLEQIVRLWETKQLGERYKSVMIRVRSDKINQDAISLLTRMNVKNVHLGIESGSDRMLGVFNKGSSVEDNQRAVDLCIQAGLRVLATFVLNGPGETMEDKRLTKEFVERNKHPLFETFFCKYKPLPGSALYAGEDPLTYSHGWYTDDLLTIPMS